MNKEKILKELKELGWDTYLDDCLHFRYGESNRYVDIDLPYIDIYVYANEEKFKGYLTIQELNAFYDLVEFLKREKENS